MTRLETVALALFWALAIIPATATVLYPALMFFHNRMHRRLTPSRPRTFPKTTLIVSAYQEEQVIRAKIENALALDYPPGGLEILVATDGSTDATDAIVGEYAGRGVRLLTAKRNRGKTLALNDAIRAATGRILVFSDANSLYRPSAVNRLVRWMGDARIGCVCGRLVYTSGGDDGAAIGEETYWDWDVRLKRWEGASGYLLGGNGAIFALRRSLAVALPGDQSNDMVHPIVARLCGFRAVFDPSAVAEEKTAPSMGGEFRRKSRIVARGIAGVTYSLRFAFCHPLTRRAPLGARLVTLAQTLGKKMSRYLMVPALGAMLLVIPALPTGTTRTLGMLLALGFASAFVAALAQILGRGRFPARPNAAYALTMAGAACHGLWRFLAGDDLARWKSQR